VTTDAVLSVAEVIPEKTMAPSAWPPLLRAGFRIAFLYFACFVVVSRNGNLFALLPVVGNWISNALQWLPDNASVWMGHHVFHLTGIAADWQQTGSGDTALNWIENGLFVLFALAGGLVWTLAAELRGKRKEYGTLHAWLRFFLRLTCGGFMLIYGFSKVFPLQMAPISIGILNEPVGNMSPMTMLWALIGLHPLYEIICGLAEAIGGVLLLFRRTALAGALVSAFVMTNVLLYNLFFDVPVKLFAANLLLGCLYLAVPDLRALWEFFWLHRPATASATWIPPTRRRWARITLRVAEIAISLALLIAIPVLLGRNWHSGAEARHTQSPIEGAWHLDTAHPASGGFMTGDGAPTSDFYIDTVQRAFRRSADGALWRTGLRIEAGKHLMTIFGAGAGGTKYSWQMPDANHLILTTVPPDAPKANGKTPAKAMPPFTPQTVSFTREPVMAHYPLLERGFHFINPWGYER
jgi:hypothetical protein